MQRFQRSYVVALLIFVIIFGVAILVFLITKPKMMSNYDSKFNRTDKLDISCQTDDDCILARTDTGFDCTNRYSCEPVDYSLDSWQAVNNQSWNKLLHQSCTDIDNIGAPLCYPQPINDRYTASCKQRICSKISIPSD